MYHLTKNKQYYYPCYCILQILILEISCNSFKPFLIPNPFMIYLFSTKSFVLGNQCLCDLKLLVKMATVPWVTVPTGYLYPPSLSPPSSNFSSLLSLGCPPQQPVLLSLQQHLLSAAHTSTFSQAILFSRFGLHIHVP